MSRRLFVVVVLCFYLIGCQTTVPVRIKELKEPAQKVDMEIVMLSEAIDVRPNPSDRVGKHTISVLMIPGPGVFTKGAHLDEAIAGHCRTALEKAGYRVSMVDYLEDGDGPVLTVQIRMVRNYSFTYLYPLGIVFGRAKLALALMSPGGEVLWEKQVKPHGGGMVSLLYISGFGTALKTELTAIFNDIAEIPTSDEFAAALQGEN